MFGLRFGNVQLGSKERAPSGTSLGKKIACINDMSDHGGYIWNTNNDNKLTVKGEYVSVEGAMHVCPLMYEDEITPHGITPLTAVTIKTYHNGELILTEGAIAGCGAVIIAVPNRRVGVE
jgi:hypothetical protein